MSFIELADVREERANAAWWERVERMFQEARRDFREEWRLEEEKRADLLKFSEVKVGGRSEDEGKVEDSGLKGKIPFEVKVSEVQCEEIGEGRDQLEWSQG